MQGNWQKAALISISRPTTTPAKNANFGYCYRTKSSRLAFLSNALSTSGELTSRLVVTSRPSGVARISHEEDANLSLRKSKGLGAFPPPPKRKSGEYIFLRKYHVKFGHFANFSYIYFPPKMSCPISWLSLYIRLWQNKHRPTIRTKTCDKAMCVYAHVKSDTVSRWPENAPLDRKPHESSESVMWMIPQSQGRIQKFVWGYNIFWEV